MVQEVHSVNGKKKEIPASEFEQNLKRKYCKETSGNPNEKSNEKPVKIFETQSRQLNAVSTKRLQVISN